MNTKINDCNVAQECAGTEGEMVMGDRELLELAAKAAGYIVKVHSDSGLGVKIHGSHEWWSPLHDDGDALRLAASLELEISLGLFGAIIYMKGGIKIEEISEDYMPATRRAIVRAAAEIGKGL